MHIFLSIISVTSKHLKIVCVHPLWVLQLQSWETLPPMTNYTNLMCDPKVTTLLVDNLDKFWYLHPPLCFRSNCELELGIFGSAYLELTTFHSKLKLLRVWPIFKHIVVRASVMHPCSNRAIDKGMILNKEAFMTSQRMLESPFTWGSPYKSMSSQQCVNYLQEVA